MIEVILTGLIFVAFGLGLFVREVLDTLKELKKGITRFQMPQNTPTAPPASFAEPMSMSEVLAEEEQERIAKLNP